MTTLDDVKSKKSGPRAKEVAAEAGACGEGAGLVLRDQVGLLKQFTKAVLETALSEEMTEHRGHDKNRAESDRESSYVRNGTGLKQCRVNPAAMSISRRAKGTGASSRR
jgi:putative transposase